MMEHFNVVFLMDANPPTKLMMLKRASFKKFAPGWYTGVGGKVENVETFLASAYRELVEETGVDTVELYPFVRCQIDNDVTLHYFWGIYKGELPSCNEGDLEWVATESVLEKQIIPTTATVMKEWQQRGFQTNESWTMCVRRNGDLTLDGVTVESITVERLESGL